jgi:hypothetical protein
LELFFYAQPMQKKHAAKAAMGRAASGEYRFPARFYDNGEKSCLQIMRKYM